MAATVDILIKATDQASGVLKTVSGATDDLGKKTGGAKGALAGLGNAASNTIEQFTGLNLATIGVAGGIVMMAGQAKKAIDAASDLNETTSKVGVVFKDSADKIKQFGESSATALGMSKNAALSAAGTYGNLFVSMGMTTAKAADMSTSLVQLAADLASFNNLSPEEVLEKLRAGLTGESEPLKSLGVNINETVIKAKAMELGLVGLTGELSASAKAQAAYALILEQTKTAQGDFARTADGAANQQRILAAQQADLAASIGTNLLPAYVSLLKVVNDVTAGLNTLLTVQERGTPKAQALSGQITKTAASYEEYTAQMKEAYGAAGYAVQVTEDGVKVMQVLGGGALKTAEGIHVLTRAEYAQAQALEAQGKAATGAAEDTKQVTQANIQAARSTTDVVLAMRDQAQTANITAAGMQAATAATAAQVEATIKASDAFKNLQTAQTSLASAQEAFNKSFGDQAVSALQAAGVKGDALSAVYGEIDKQLGTTYRAQDENRRKLAELSQQYASGKISAQQYAQGLNAQKPAWEALDSNIQKAQTDLMKARAEFDLFVKNLKAANNMTIKINIDASSGGGGGGSCFVYDTPVCVPDGSRKIGEIQAGDTILLKQHDGGLIQVTVEGTKQDHRNDLVEVETSDGVTVCCSPNHEWMIRGYGWCWAVALRPGDELITADDHPASVVGVKPVHGGFTVYNLHVSHPEHSYMVNGYAVHNARAEPKAAGGFVRGGALYLVGEQGPELFVPEANGQIIPSRQTSAIMSGAASAPSPVAGGITINGPITVVANDPQTFVKKLASFGRRQALSGAGYAGG